MKRLLFLVAFLLVGGLQLTLSEPAAAQAPTCQFFAETGGFNVCNDASAQFLTAFNRYGLQRVGYPISRRYERDGFVTQAFQKAIFQWRPDGNYVAFVNVFDELHNMGFDQRLLDTRQTPMPVQNFDPPGATFEQIVQARQALLSARPAIRTAYFSVSDPLLFYGLPTSQVQDMGNHYAIRLQRAVLQEWKEAVPWAAAGQVTVANGADIAKELGAVPAAALVPEQAGGAPAPPNAPEPPFVIGPSVMAKSVGPMNEPVDVTDVFPADTMEVHFVVFMPRVDRGARFFARWWRGGTPFEDSALLVADQNYTDVYVDFWIESNTGTPFQPGTYYVELYGNERVVASRNFTIQAP